MSLWAVPDRATAALMDDLYAGLLDLDRPLAAQRAALARQREVGAVRPGEWAPFVGAGGWRAGAVPGAGAAQSAARDRR